MHLVLRRLGHLVNDTAHARERVLVRLGYEPYFVRRVGQQVENEMKVLTRKVLMDEQVSHTRVLQTGSGAVGSSNYTKVKGRRILAPALPPLQPGAYTISPTVTDGDRHEYTICDWIEHAQTVQIGGPFGTGAVMRPPVEVTVLGVTDGADMVPRRVPASGRQP